MTAEQPSVEALRSGIVLAGLTYLEPALDSLTAALSSLMADSWRAYAEAGADTDGDLKWHCSPAMAGVSLVDAVTQLRKDYDETSAALERAERERDKLMSYDRNFKTTVDALTAAVQAAEARAQKAEAVVEAARQYLDTGRGDLDGALAAYDADLIPARRDGEPPTEQIPGAGHPTC